MPARAIGLRRAYVSPSTARPQPRHGGALRDEILRHAQIGVAVELDDALGIVVAARLGSRVEQAS